MLAKSGSSKAVVIISLDGVGYNQLKKIDPNFLHRNSVCSTVPPIKSFTFPAHQTIAIRKNIEPEDTQRIDCPKSMNDFICNNLGDKLLVKPMWTKATELGFDVQTYLWPSASSAWNGIDHHKDKNYPPTQLPEDEKSTEVFQNALSALIK